MASKTKKKNVSDVNSFVNTGLLVCLLIYATIVTLLLFRNFFTAYKPGCEGIEDLSEDDGLTLPYLPLDEDDFLTLLTPDSAVSCQNLVNMTSKVLEQRTFTGPGSEATTLCKDTLPHNMSPSNCRIYSIDPHTGNIFFELMLGHMGCRVHVITKSTNLNYGRISNNSYLYPLHLSPHPGNSHYSLDSYINLMSHEMKDIHVVKTGVNGSEWRFLTTLYTSRTQAWMYIKQLRMVITVPELTSSTRDEFSYKYLLLKGLRLLHFHLVYSKPLVFEDEKPATAETTDFDQEPTPTEAAVEIRPKRFETIWLKR